MVGIPDPARGQLVAAAIVLQAGRSATADAIRSRLRAELSAYKVPRHLFLYRSEDLPFTDSGKIDKHRLAQLLAERAAEA